VSAPATFAHWLFALSSAGAVLFFFAGLPSFLERRPDRPAWVRGIHLFGLVLALGHVGGAFFLTPRSDEFAAAGVVMYTVSVSLFLSAMEASSGIRLQRSFVDHPLPNRLITAGPYRWVRHPFYLGYIIGALAPPVATGSAWLLLISLQMIAVVVAAGMREERLWLMSPRGDQYRSYQRMTGMFLPRIGRLSGS
jgi:protein-S-isoprenylcysteine O-methyltransferase Ste14